MSPVFSRRALGAAGLAALPVTRLRAEQYPARPVTYVVPYEPGGTNDAVGRIFARQLTQRLGQNVVVENRSGAGGTIAATYVARARPDGTLLLNASSANLTSAPQLLRAPYDPEADLLPVGFLGHYRYILAVDPRLPIHSFPDFLEYARRHPGRLNYGTAGVGTGSHLAGEYLRLRTGIDITHVPYRGSGQVLSAAVAGDVQFVMDALAIGHVQAGRLRAIAFWGASAAEDLPGVPHIREVGLPDWNLTQFFVAVAPAGTPEPVVRTLHAAIAEASRAPETVAALKALGVEAQPLSLAETAALLRQETAVNREVIQAAGIRVS
ncbi:Bug family tripartite tricarboxylate transporter substrate binding protein [Roseococcus sp.]|uniref:Bug family tripartite tricarboxylate transporter substrate binding protein n=1 Tax=Roseococcus sp. TaxID=2109646 RepID=UPI003BA93B5F